MDGVRQRNEADATGVRGGERRRSDRVEAADDVRRSSIDPVGIGERRDVEPGELDLFGTASDTGSGVEVSRWVGRRRQAAGCAPSPSMSTPISTDVPTTLLLHKFGKSD